MFCAECGKEIEDNEWTAKNKICQPCYYKMEKQYAAIDPVKIKKQSQPKRVAIFQFVSIGMIVVALLTPRFMVTIPCMVIIICAIISIVLNEPRKLLTILIALVSVAIMISTPTAIFNNNSISTQSQTAVPQVNYIQNMEIVKWNWETEENYNYIRGRIKNNGNKVVTYFKIKSMYYDKNDEVIDMDYTNSTETMPPNTSKEFEIMHKNNREHKKANLIIEEVRAE